MSFIDALQLLFIGLKLSGHIDWAWWQVLLPAIVKLSLFAITAFFED